MPSPTADSSPSAPSTPSGQPNTQKGSEQSRSEASKKLQEAGEQLAKAGQQLPSGESDPLMPEGQSSPAGGESDPLMPEGQSTPAGGESDPLMPEGQTAASGGESDPLMPEGPASDSSEGNPNGDTEWADGEVSEEILAAREALEKAGIALQTAGTTLETASTDEELAAAQEQLGRARLAVIIAGQDLMDIKGLLEEGQIPEDIFADTEEALNEANVAIVIATDLFPELQLPQLGLPSGGLPGSQGSVLDDELNESIAIFEGKILDARQEVLGNAPPPTSADNVPGVAILGGTGQDPGEGEEGTFGDISSGDSDMIFEDGEGNEPPGSEPEIAATENISTPIPEDIPDPQGDDIVAQQLREAAIAETDPALREKLWEEYRRYKAGL